MRFFGHWQKIRIKYFRWSDFNEVVKISRRNQVSLIRILVSIILQINHETNIQLTSGFIRRQTIRAAISLQKLGYKKGDIFAFAAKNSHYVAPLVYSTICIGCTVSTLDTSFTKAELIHMLTTTKPNIMFCDADIYDLIQECLNELDNNAKIYTFSGRKGDSIPVEDLFAENLEEKNFA